MFKIIIERYKLIAILSGYFCNSSLFLPSLVASLVAWSFSLVLHLGVISSFCSSTVGFLFLVTIVQFSSVLLSCVRLFATPWTAAHQASLSVVNSQSLLKLMSIESVMSSNHLILCHPLLLPPSIFPSIRSFQMSQFFTSGGQSIGVSTSKSPFPMNIQDWLPLGRTGWISLQSKGLSRVFSNTTVQKHQFFSLVFADCIELFHLWLQRI